MTALLLSSGSSTLHTTSTNHHFAPFYSTSRYSIPPFTASRFAAKLHCLTFSDMSDVHNKCIFENCLYSFHKGPLPIHRRCLLPCLTYACNMLPPRIIHKSQLPTSAT